MFETEVYTVESVCGINAYRGIPNASKRLWNVYKLANALFLGKYDDMKFLQYAIVARPTT